jgi:hypothetical protein
LLRRMRKRLLMISPSPSNSYSLTFLI